MGIKSKIVCFLLSFSLCLFGTSENFLSSFHRVWAENDNLESFLDSAADTDFFTAYDGTNEQDSFSVNGVQYFQGFTLYNDTPYMEQTCSGTFDVSDFSTIQISSGHIDETELQNGTLQIYLDDELTQEVNLCYQNAPQVLTLDVSESDNVKFSMKLSPLTGYGFGRICFDEGDSTKYQVPVYSDAMDFLNQGYQSKYYKIYSEEETFRINEQSFSKGFTFYNSYVYDVQECRCFFNVEQLDHISFIYGHLDGTEEGSGTLEIYLDGMLSDSILLEADATLTEYGLNVSKASVLMLQCEMPVYTGYGFGAVKIDPVVSTTTETETTTTNFTSTTTSSTTTEPVVTTIEPTQQHIVSKGDANEDGAITIEDAYLILNYSAQHAAGNDSFVFQEDAKRNAAILQAVDVNQNGQIDLMDALYTLKYYACSASGKQADWESILT